METAVEKRPRVPRGMKAEGVALWSYGFRPFFLGGAIWAVAAMALWIAALIHGLPLGGDYGAPLWHAHEMVFGFAPAVLAGFLLTAIPNWTGSLPVSGGPLAALTGLWLVGRVAMAAADWTGMALAAALDAVFLPALLAIAAREVVAGRKWKDLKVLAGVAMVTLGNLSFHGTVLTGGDTGLALRAAVAGYVALVLIIGGRIIVSFTHNWLLQRGVKPLPVAYNRFDMGTIVLSAAALAFWAIWPEARFTGVLALIAALLNAIRLARWRGLAVRSEALLLVLHAAYAFVPLGFLAIAAAQVGLILPASALHVLTVGVIGCTMLAVMTRATRGHTGRALTASGATRLSYLCLFVAALARPLADVTGALWLLEAAGGLWIAAFVLYLGEYGPMLLRARRAARGA